MPKKLRLYLCSTIILLCIGCAMIPPQDASKKSETMVRWGSEEGIRRLEESRYKVDFFKLANHFESQSNKLFCGAASAVIVLNTLRIRQTTHTLPADNRLLTADELQSLATQTWSPLFQRYTQNNIFLASPKSRQAVLGQALQGQENKVKKDKGFLTSIKR